LQIPCHKRVSVGVLCYRKYNQWKRVARHPKLGSKQLNEKAFPQYGAKLASETSYISSYEQWAWLLEILEKLMKPRKSKSFSKKTKRAEAHNLPAKQYPEYVRDLIGSKLEEDKNKSGNDPEEVIYGDGFVMR
jgi:hypothetical protein